MSDNEQRNLDRAADTNTANRDRKQKEDAAKISALAALLATVT